MSKVVLGPETQLGIINIVNNSPSLILSPAGRMFLLMFVCSQGVSIQRRMEPPY